MKENLEIEIRSLLQNSPYVIKVLTIDDRCFGNIYLELSGSKIDLRFIQDRGDVYVEKRIANTAQWDECLFLSHQQSDGESYGLFVKAVRSFVVKVLNV